MKQSVFARLRFSNVLPTCEPTDFNQMNWYLIKVSGEKGQVTALLDRVVVGVENERAATFSTARNYSTAG